MNVIEHLDSIESDYASFGTVYVGGFPTEATTVTLTSDGTDLYTDGQKVWTQYNDGEGSGLDADTLDGHHADTFLVLESSGLPSNVCVFGTSGNNIIDSGYTITDFLTIDPIVYKGILDCSENPEFPTALTGDFYKVSNGGLIGGEFGTVVSIGDNIVCNTNTSAGTFASIGMYWDIIPAYYSDAYISGPITSINNTIPIFDGISGRLIKTSNIDIDTVVTSLDSAISNNIVIFGTSSVSVIDSGSKISDFATVGDITNHISDDDALAYSIAFGG
jgi:hypothetical protein